MIIIIIITIISIHTVHCLGVRGFAPVPLSDRAATATASAAVSSRTVVSLIATVTDVTMFDGPTLGRRPVSPTVSSYRGHHCVVTCLYYNAQTMRLLIRTLTCKTKEYEKYQYHPKLRGTHCRVEIIIKAPPHTHTHPHPPAENRILPIVHRFVSYVFFSLHTGCFDYKRV